MSDYNLERLNILIVDDNEHMRVLIRSILAALGAHNCQEASNGADAFNELRNFSADLIICDWDMDPLDGLDFMRMVRTDSDSVNPFVPIIMLIGSKEVQVADAQNSGASEFLVKPVSATKLYEQIKSIIEHPRPFVQTTGRYAYFGPDRRKMTAAAVPGDPFAHFLQSEDEALVDD